MTPEQASAAKSLKIALRKVRDANLRLLTYDGQVWVFPLDGELWPDGEKSSVFDVLETFGADVTVPGLSADGGAGV